MPDVLYRPFFEATRDVLRLMLDVGCAADGAGEEGPRAGERLMISVGVTGDLTGQVVYRFPKETSLMMVQSMTGMEFSEIDDFVTSAIGEIANIISGNVMSALSQQAITCDILPPRMLEQGETVPEGGRTISVSTELGPLDLLLLLDGEAAK